MPGENRSGAQPGAFTDAAANAGIQHGMTARVEVSNVRSERTEKGAAVFFCHSRVRVLEVLEAGDGQPMPQTDMIIEDIGDVPEECNFAIEGIITSNGRNVFRRTMPKEKPRNRLRELLGIDT